MKRKVWRNTRLWISQVNLFWTTKPHVSPILSGRKRRLLWDVLTVYRDLRGLSSSIVTSEALASFSCWVIPCWEYPPHAIGSNVFLPPTTIYIASHPLDSTELSEQYTTTQHMGNTLQNCTYSQSDLLGEDCWCVTLAKLHFSAL